jgi:hypothetical protein
MGQAINHIYIKKIHTYIHTYKCSGLSVCFCQDEQIKICDTNGWNERRPAARPSLSDRSPARVHSQVDRNLFLLISSACNCLCFDLWILPELHVILSALCLSRCGRKRKICLNQTPFLQRRRTKWPLSVLPSCQVECTW